jgi:hypothetical protein
MKTKNDYQSLLTSFKIKGVELKKLLLLVLIGSSVIITSCGGNQSKKDKEEKTNAVATAEPKIVKEQVLFSALQHPKNFYKQFGRVQLALHPC